MGSGESVSARRARTIPLGVPDGSDRLWIGDGVRPLSTRTYGEALTPDMMTTQKSAETQPVMAYNMILRKVSRANEVVERQRATHIARLVLVFLSGPVPACPPSVLVAVPVVVLLSVAFHAASVANR